jgi:hypothetical protein
MTRSALAGVLLALLGAALVAPPAAVAEAPPLAAPVVTIEGGDSTVSELQQVTVTGLEAAAVSVRLEYDGLPAQVATVDNGAVPPFDIETWGLSSPPDRNLVVSQCREPLGLMCGDTTTVVTTVSNPSPTDQLSRSGTEFSQPFDLTVHLAHTTGAPRIQLSTDGGAAEYVDPEAATTIPVGALSAGPHSIEIAVCSSDQTRCTATLRTVSFGVVKTVPGTFSVSAPAFSPNGDGKFDTISFNYTQQVVWESAVVEVLNAADVSVYSGPVPLPQAPSNAGTFPYNGKDGLGVVLPDGVYTAELTVSRTLDSNDPVSSTYTQSFTVDNTAHAPVTLKPSFTTFYPYDDGYRDAVKFAYAGLEPYSRVDLMVWNSANPPVLVRLKQLFVVADRSWNGRDDDGARVPAGSYTVRVRVVDNLGNVAFSPIATVTVSDKRLVTVTKAVTVTPKASMVKGVTGSCSARRTPSSHGWAGSTGYLSNTRCRTTFKASIVWTLNKTKLASAVTYHWVRLGWYGGPTKAATHDHAIASFYRTDGTAVGWYSSVDVMTAQYIPSAKGSAVVKGGYVLWGFQADRGNRYDVKSFTLTYRADVLR